MSQRSAEEAAAVAAAASAPLSSISAPTKKQTSTFALPRTYTTFFLLIEPLSAIAGACCAFYTPETYLSLTHAPSTPTELPLSTAITLTQLANLYLLFALNEALVLRSTSDLRVWSALLFGLLIADFGHLYSVAGLGWGVYWKVWEWNAMMWGNVGFVYVGAAMRICFLSGVGMGRGRAVKSVGKEL